MADKNTDRRVRLSSDPAGTGRRRPLRIAIVGADGAGKSTITGMLERADLPAPVKRIYMGVNLEASSMMLPTTRLLLAAKQRRGGRPDLVAEPQRVEPRERPLDTGDAWRSRLKDTARLTVWMLEEWSRQVVAMRYSRRGHIVVFDRHFFADYYQAEAPAGAQRGLAMRFHQWMLRHAYPKPDLVICLDAPGSVLYARKPEATAEWLEQRRQQYLRLAAVVPAFEVVDVDRPLPQVLADVESSVHRHWKANAA